MDRLKFLLELETIIAERIADRPAGSYTAQLATAGIGAVARKVGEEGVELALASVTESDERVVDEAADVLFHVLVLLRLKDLTLADVVRRLEARHAPNAS